MYVEQLSAILENKHNGQIKREVNGADEIEKNSKSTQKIL